MRQASFIYRHGMFDDSREKAAWQIREIPADAEGLPWIRKAIKLGGQHMEPVLKKVAGYNEAARR